MATRDATIAELEGQLRVLREEAAALETAVGELSALLVLDDMQCCLSQHSQAVLQERLTTWNGHSTLSACNVVFDCKESPGPED